MNRKSTISPDAFIYPALAELDIPEQDEALFRKFVQSKADKLDALWAEFLEDEAFDQLASRQPCMRTLIKHTPLSNRIKKVLEKGYVTTIGELVQYSLDELSHFRGLGEGSLLEIEEYLTSIGFGHPGNKESSR